MSKKEELHDHLENVVEAVVYAPLGLLYEYDNVIPKLVKRGKSQVQLAKLLGKAAAKGAPDSALKGANGVSDLVSRGLLEVGGMLGLTPDMPDGKSSQDAKKGTETAPSTKPDTTTTPKKPESSTSDVSSVEAKAKERDLRPKKDAAQDKASTASSSKQANQLPIVGYDSLTAKEVIRLVGDLTPSQRKVIRDHEESNRNRKTIRAKLDRLDP